MVKRDKGCLFIVSAPSGAGKTTLCKKILELFDNLKPSVSFTTRQPREGEVHAVDYTFVDEKTFRAMIQDNAFVEWAEVHGNLYGTGRRQLDDLLHAGYDVILDIDTQGARQIRKTFSGGVFIFIMPPSLKELRYRLEHRRSNTPEDMAMRLKRAEEEIREYNMYDYVIVNDILNESLKKFESIIIAERLRSGSISQDTIQTLFYKED